MKLLGSNKIREGKDEKSEGGDHGGTKMKARKVKTGCRQVCDLFKEL